MTTLPRPLPGSLWMLLPRDGAATDIAQALDDFAELAARSGRSGSVLCEAPLPDLRSRHPDLAVIALPCPARSLLETLLRSLPPGIATLACAGSPALVTPGLLAAADAVVVCARPASPPLPEPDAGCTLITSLHRAERFLPGFLTNMQALTGYDRLTDHIFLAADLSATEAELLAPLPLDRPNSLLLRLREDPGLYACWNLAIGLARRPYLSNANVDDLRDPDHLVTLIADLEARPWAPVAASALVPFHAPPPPGTLPARGPAWYAERPGPFGLFDLAFLTGDQPEGLAPCNIPHCMPVWRRDLHARYGLFDEARHGTYADWAFWLGVLQDGAKGWLNSRPLGYYFVNPTSHNRRGSDLEARHRTVEAAYIALFRARRDGLPHQPRHDQPAPVRKLDLGERDKYYGVHRNGFHRVIDALTPLARPEGDGLRFLPFVERRFVWGTAPGEAASDSPLPMDRDWTGILHVPFGAPDWCEPEISPETFFATPLWQASRRFCRGLLTFSADLAADLRHADPDLPVLSLLHPTGLDAPQFEMARYRAFPRVVQVGDWLRKLQAIHRLRAPGHERVMLLKGRTQHYLDREITRFGDMRDPHVRMLSMVSDDAYDRLLASSVVLCLMYATAANNAVIECLARATPIIVNPLPAVVEYLGPDYPLYAGDTAEADALLARPERIEAAHYALLTRRAELDLSYEGFGSALAASTFYARL